MREFRRDNEEMNPTFQFFLFVPLSGIFLGRPIIKKQRFLSFLFYPNTGSDVLAVAHISTVDDQKCSPR
jgi:hypothetical protein